MEMKISKGTVEYFHTDCTNGGVSSRISTFNVFYNCTKESAIKKANELKYPLEECLWVEQMRPDFARAIPMTPRPQDMIGPMFGGNRIVFQMNKTLRKLSILDRYETPEEYEALSM